RFAAGDARVGAARVLPLTRPDASFSRLVRCYARHAMADESAAAASPIATVRARARSALRRPHNWVQLAKFCTLGAIAYVVNLAVYTTLVHAGLHYNLAAACSLLVAV